MTLFEPPTGTGIVAVILTVVLFEALAMSAVPTTTAAACPSLTDPPRSTYAILTPDDPVLLGTCAASGWDLEFKLLNPANFSGSWQASGPVELQLYLPFFNYWGMPIPCQCTHGLATHGYFEYELTPGVYPVVFATDLSPDPGGPTYWIQATAAFTATFSDAYCDGMTCPGPS
jgi:hypothetical protein